MRFDASRIVEITRGNLAIAPLNACEALVGLSWDSRTIQPGWVYAALPGERVDGHDFALAAMRAGARMVLASHELDGRAQAFAREQGCAVLVVDDVALAIAQLAEAWRNQLDAAVVGVTGSVGKTTTKSLIRQVLSARFRTHATKGNYNNELGAPFTVLSAPESCEALVVEMGMDDLRQIEYICSFAHPGMGIVTNVGVSHLERLGTRENIARAKAELFEALPEGGVAFVNGSDDMADFLVEHARLADRGVSVVCYDGSGACANVTPGEGWRGGDAVWAEDIEVDSQGRPRFTLCVRGLGAAAPGDVVRCACSLGLRGVHNVGNACGAAAIGMACGVGVEAVAKALAAAEPEAGRQELKRASCGAEVFDDSYNASPASMKASLSMLSSYETHGRRIAVLGDMGELGAAAQEGHIETGRAAAACDMDVLVCVGEMATAIAEGARDAGMPDGNIVCVADAEGALAALDGRLAPEDVVLVKASHFMRLDRVVEGLVD